MDNPILPKKQSGRFAILLGGLIVAAVALFMVAIPAPAAQYFRYFSIIHPSVTMTQPRGINNSGVVVGAYGSNSQGFVWENGAFTAFHGPDGSSAIPYAINALGEIVGNDSTGGFLYSGGTFTTLAVPGGSATSPSGINDSGTIVGSYLSQTNVQQAFVYSGGSYTTMAFPRGTSGSLSGINNSGQIVGFYANSTGGFHAFVYSSGGFQNLFGSICQSSVATGINNLGQIVGYCNGRAYLYNLASHTYMFFNEPDGLGSVPSGTLPFGINDSGRVTGQYDADNSGAVNGFLAVPIQ